MITPMMPYREVEAPALTLSGEIRTLKTFAAMPERR